MKTPIDDMTQEEIKDACIEICSVPEELFDEYLVGSMIKKLQEWGVGFTWSSRGWLLGGGCYFKQSLQVAFVKEAIIQGKWSPPKPKEELVYLRAHDGQVMIWPSGYPLKDYINVGGWKRVSVTDWKE